MNNIVDMQGVQLSTRDSTLAIVSLGNVVTSASGHSEFTVKVTHTYMELAYVNESCTFGELRVHFDPSSFDSEIHGMIFGDEVWLDEFRHWLLTNRFVPLCDYSESGMQGPNLVSLDVGSEFIHRYGCRIREQQANA